MHAGPQLVSLIRLQHTDCPHLLLLAAGHETLQQRTLQRLPLLLLLLHYVGLLALGPAVFPAADTASPLHRPPLLMLLLSVLLRLLTCWAVCRHHHRLHLVQQQPPQPVVRE